MKLLKKTVALLIFCLLLICWKPVKVVEKSIKMDKSAEVITEIVFTFGQLDIIGSEMQNLMEGTFSFTDEEWEPSITYTEKSEKGNLRIENNIHTEDYNFDDDNECRWDIKLNKRISTDLSIEILAGTTNINLSNCNLTLLRYEMKAGESKINLKNTSIPDLRFKAIAGEATIDLSGKWNNNLNASLKGGIGQLNLIVPKDVGIQMEVTGFLGSVNTPGYKKDGNFYTNKAYMNTPNTLYLDITGGIGEITVKESDE